MRREVVVVVKGTLKRVDDIEVYRDIGQRSFTIEDPKAVLAHRQRRQASGTVCFDEPGITAVGSRQHGPAQPLAPFGLDPARQKEGLAGHKALGIIPRPALEAAINIGLRTLATGGDSAEGDNEEPEQAMVHQVFVHQRDSLHREEINKAKTQLIDWYNSVAP